MRRSIAFYGAVLLAAIFFTSNSHSYGQGRPAAPTQVIAQYGSQDPAGLSPAQLYQLAVAYEEMQQYRESLALLQRYHEREPTQTYALNDMARVATKSGRTTEAVGYLEQAVAAEPDDFYLGFKLAEAYHTAGDYINGSDACNDLLDRGYNTPQVWVLMGECTQALGLASFAVNHYGEAWRQSPYNRNYALKYINLIMAWNELETGFINAGLAMCDSVLHYNSLDPDIRLAKALLHYRGLDYKSADPIFDSFLEQGDSLPMVLRYGGLTRVHVNRNLDALPLLLPTYHSDPTDFTVVMALANALSNMSRYSEAEVFLEEAEELLKFELRHYSIEYTRGKMFQKRKNPEQAVYHYYKAYLYTTGSIDLLQTMVSLLPYRSDDPEATREKSTFLLHALLNKYAEPGESINKGFQRYYAQSLDKMIEDAFFHGKERVTLRTPDNKTSTIPVETLRTMRQRLDADSASGITIQ